MSLSGHEFELRRVTGCVGKEAEPAEALTSEQAARMAGCDGKGGYPSMYAALTAMKRTIRRRKFRCEPGERLAPYRCRYCQRFHIGSAMK